MSAPTSVVLRADRGRRPEATTHVQLEAFDGPLALLLSLIEARQLDVLAVPLGGLATAYLDALAGLEADRIRNISAFVAVASHLILIKSRALLPRPPDPAQLPVDEGPDPEAELRARLVEYRAHRDAGLRLQAEADARGALFRREPSAAQVSALASASSGQVETIDPTLLVRALDRLARIVVPPEPPPEIVPRTITLTERAEAIRAALRDVDAVVLQELLAGVRDRVVVAVTFLAMLELVKRREISIEQAEPWGPIVARRLAAAPRVLDGTDGKHGDHDPIDETLGSFG